MDSKIRYVKTYVDVVVRMRTDGTNVPMKVIWDDQEYTIDKVLRVMAAPPKKVAHIGGPTIKHVCLMNGQEKELFLEDNPRRWFVEKPVVQF